MEFYSARKFLVICIIGLIVFGLIAFLSPNRNVQMATMIIVKILGAVGIIALIIFLVARSKRRKEEY